MHDPSLTLVQLEPRDEGGVTYPPFEKSAEYEFDWSDFLVDYEPDQDSYFAAYDGDTEVARAEVVLRDLGEGYKFRPSGSTAVIEFLEVAVERRSNGVGGRFLAMLIDRFPDKTLLALSEADGFWDEQGWTRYDHADGRRYRPLYVHEPATSGR